MNQKKRNQTNEGQVEPKPKKAKETSQRKPASERTVRQSKKGLEKGTEQDEDEKNRKLQEREVKRRKREDEKKKRR